MKDSSKIKLIFYGIIIGILATFGAQYWWESQNKSISNKLVKESETYRTFYICYNPKLEYLRRWSYDNFGTVMVIQDKDRYQKEIHRITEAIQE